MEDYLRIYDRGFEFEKKLLTNFDVSVKYINNEWEGLEAELISSSGKGSDSLLP